MTDDATKPDDDRSPAKPPLTPSGIPRWWRDDANREGTRVQAYIGARDAFRFLKPFLRLR